jgi:hypothetical protein
MITALDRAHFSVMARSMPAALPFIRWRHDPTFKRVAIAQVGYVRFAGNIYELSAYADDSRQFGFELFGPPACQTLLAVGVAPSFPQAKSTAEQTLAQLLEAVISPNRGG